MGHLGGGEAPALRPSRPITEASQPRIPARKSSIGILSPRLFFAAARPVKAGDSRRSLGRIIPKRMPRLTKTEKNDSIAVDAVERIESLMIELANG